MTTHDGQPYEPHTLPEIGEIEQEFPNDYRECARALLPVLTAVLEAMPECVEKWSVAFALGSPICGGHSMAKIAQRFGVSRALISYNARRFCEANGLTPSGYMRAESACQAAAEARKSSVGKNVNVVARAEQPTNIESE